MRVHFVLVCEGPSDEALIPHLRSLLVHCGAREATGTAPDFSRLRQGVSRSIGPKVQLALKHEKHVDLLFVHRDADSTNPSPRYDEIRNGVDQAGYANAWIGVVPVQETEAWLLLDESAIRRASGRPRGQVVLNLPSPNHVEEITNPKRYLRDTIILASETVGRRLDRLEKKFPARRSQLLEELKPDGPLLSVSSWMRLKTDIQGYVDDRRTNHA